MSYKYTTVVLYTGEVPSYSCKPDCWQFDSLTEAADWIVNNGYASNRMNAVTGLSRILSGRSTHYKQFTISVAYTNPAMYEGGSYE